MSNVEQPLRILIVDDEPSARNRLRDLLCDCNEQLALEIVGEAGNGQEALDKLMETPADVVLLDIRMPQMDGIELAQHIHKIPKPVLNSGEADAGYKKWPPVIIFTTAYDSYAVKAFELHAIDYLMKPIRMKRLFDALTRARDAVPVQTEVLRELLPEPRKFLSIHERGKILLVPIEQVLFLRAELKYTTVRTAEREYLIEEPLTALENEFAAHFVRIHRNCLVAKEAIAGFEKGGGEEGEGSGWMVRLKGLDELLAISRRQQHIVREFG
ncbi:MAG: LytTR family DNA-binding domain-containing protein [Gallionellaceae bacterium]|jgi:two-component system response regulator AlgR|nr:LytTR family DNA-binding domain-containing protein [Gallionellaceae bacterium]